MIGSIFMMVIPNYTHKQGLTAVRNPALEAKKVECGHFIMHHSIDSNVVHYSSSIFSERRVSYMRRCTRGRDAQGRDAHESIGGLSQVQCSLQSSPSNFSTRTEMVGLSRVEKFQVFLGESRLKLRISQYLSHGRSSGNHSAETTRVHGRFAASSSSGRRKYPGIRLVVRRTTPHVRDYDSTVA